MFHFALACSTTFRDAEEDQIQGDDRQRGVAILKYDRPREQAIDNLQLVTQQVNRVGFRRGDIHLGGAGVEGRGRCHGRFRGNDARKE